jgi:hypothetical protein
MPKKRTTVDIVTPNSVHSDCAILCFSRIVTGHVQKEMRLDLSVLSILGPELYKIFKNDVNLGSSMLRRDGNQESKEGSYSFAEFIGATELN